MSRRKSLEPLYKISDTVLCNFHGQLYDAIILETKHVDILEKEKRAANESGSSSEAPISVRSMSTENGTKFRDRFAYYLHYKNWNSSWDEWVRSDCLMAISEEARKIQLELKFAAKKEKIKKTSSRKRRRRIGKKSASESQNGNLDEGSLEAGVNETLEVQELMEDDVHDVDEDCAVDEDERINERTEDLQAVVNVEDSTNACTTNIETKTKTLNINLSTEGTIVCEDNLSKPGQAPKEESLSDFNLVPPKEASEKDTKIPENLCLSGNEVESTPASLTTTRRASSKIGKRMTADVKSGDNILPIEPKMSIAVQGLGTTKKQPHLEEEENMKLEPKGKKQKTNDNSNHSGIIVEHPCSLIGAPTVNDVLPELGSHLCTIDSIGNIQGPAFVNTLGLMYEIFCKELVLPSVKYSAEQAMNKNGTFGNVVHFSGLLKLISVLESGEWSNEKYYKRLQEAEISCELEDLQTVFHECKEYFEIAKRFLLAKVGYYVKSQEKRK